MPMWGLRLILILLGAAFVAGVYFYTRRHPPGSRKKDTPPQRREPTMRLNAPQRPVTRTQAPAPPVASPPSEREAYRRQAAGNKPVPDTPVRSEPVTSEAGKAMEDARASREEIVFSLALRLPGEGVPAERLVHQLRRLGLALDDRRIYSHAGPDGEPLFSVANLFEPGVLDPLSTGEKLQGLSFFFMAEPSPSTGSRFDRMLGAAYECARALGGHLEDMNHRPLTAARELELKLAAEGSRSD